MPDLPHTEPEIDVFLAAFEAGTLPKERWNHAAHLLTGACYVYTLGEAHATARMRERVSAYNHAVGGQNTPTSGYHETVTVFWIKLLTRFLATTQPGAPCLASETWEGPLTRSKFAHLAVAEFSARRNIYADYYDFDILASTEARRIWIPPNLRNSGKW